MKIKDSDLKEFENYIEMCNDEFGGYCDSLINLYYNLYSFAPEKFVNELEKEILEQLKYFKERTVIVEKEKMFTFKELEWIEE